MIPENRWITGLVEGATRRLDEGEKPSRVDGTMRWSVPAHQPADAVTDATVSYKQHVAVAMLPNGAVTLTHVHVAFFHSTVLYIVRLVTELAVRIMHAFEDIAACVRTATADKCQPAGVGKS